MDPVSESGRIGMAAITNCPPQAEYERMAQGLLADEQSAQLLEHADQCENCLRLVESLQEQSTLAELLLGRQEASPLGQGATLQNLMNRLHGLAALPLLLGSEDTVPPDPAPAGPAGKVNLVRLKCPVCQASLKT